jgi:hypothetical protein
MASIILRVAFLDLFSIELVITFVYCRLLRKIETQFSTTNELAAPPEEGDGAVMTGKTRILKSMIVTLISQMYA